MIGELTNHLWQSTFFAATAGVLTLAFRKNRARVRFWVWLCASLKFFVPFAFLMSLGSHLHWTPAAQSIATQIAAPAVSFTVEEISQPFPVSASAFPVAQSHTNWIPLAVLGIWLCGFIAVALIRLRNWQGIRSALRASLPLQIPAAVGIRSAPGLLEPGVVGLLNPVLLLPEGIVELLTPSQLEAVLAHELCHVRRRDNLFAAIHMVIEAVFWFHPLVWWIGARLVEERERACDEDVLSLGNQPRNYADAILNVCKLYVESPLVCVSGVTGSNIKRRIEAIMRNHRGQTLNRAKKILLACAGFAALAGPVAIGIVIGIGHAQMIRAQSPVSIPMAAQMPAPMIALAAPVEATPGAPEPQQSTPQAAVVPATDPAAPITRFVDNRLVAMLFDFSTMTSDQQSAVRTVGLNFVQNSLTPGDLACVMLAVNGPVSVVQDFTTDPAALQSAIQKLDAAGSAPASDVDSKLATIMTAAKMLGGFPNKKALVYFSSGITQTGVDNQAALTQVINTAKQANVAIFPVDARGLTPSTSAANAQAQVKDSDGRDLFSYLRSAPAAGNTFGPTANGVPAGGGRGPGRGVAVPPPGVSQDEYNRRVAYAQANFGSAPSAMGRTYIRYGAPDQIDTPASATQTWRYKYLEDFHGGAAFEFTTTNPLAGQVIYPAPMATYQGQSGSASQLALLAAALARESQTSGQTPSTNVNLGLPGRHVSVQINAAVPWMPVPSNGKGAAFSIPLDSLSGTVDIVGQVRALRAVLGPVAGNLRDSAQASTGTYQAAFTLQPGLYVLNVLVREQSSGRMFGETIDIDVP